MAEFVNLILEYYNGGIGIFFALIFLIFIENCLCRVVF